MAIISPESVTPERKGSVLFEIEGDLDHQGRFGKNRLVVTEGEAIRYEDTPAGEEVIGSYSLRDLTAPRFEQMVDAGALLATVNGREVELLRTTNRHTIQLTDAEKRLSYLLEGKPLPPISADLRKCPTCGRPLAIDDGICPYCIDRRKTLMRLFQFTDKHRFRLFWGTLLMFLGVGAQLLPPAITADLLDNALIKHKSNLLGPLLAGLVGANLLTMAINIARQRNTAFLGMKITVAIRARLFEKYQELSMGFYDKRNVGSLMSRMINDTGALYDVLVDGIPVLLQQIALMIGVPIVLFIMNWHVAIWALVPVPLVAFGVTWFRHRMEKIWSRFWHNWSRLGSTLNGILQGTRVVKAFHGEYRETNRFESKLSSLAETQYFAESSWATMFPIVVFTMSLSTFVAWWIGGRNVLDGQLTVGQLMAIIFYVGMLQQPLQSLQRIIDWSTRALTAAERVFEILDTPPEIADSSNAIQIPKMRGEIKFSDVHFGYDKAREVLHGIDVSINPGEMIGIVGPSGSGKTTLINLLMRYYDPTQGHIEIDGVDLREIKIDDLRRQVGVVLQESYLFPGSIRHNIAYGRPGATLDEIIAAAKAANAHDFIVNFPDGYDSYVGERGQRLSGGERQRIAIARAILHNPKILILDEATASVDTETERMIQEALERLVEGRTVVAIAHRLSTLRNADRLIVIEDGKVAEIGTHDQLMAEEDGTYRKLVEMQMEISKSRAEVLFD